MRWQVNGERTVYSSDWVHVKLVEVEPPGREPFEHHLVHVVRDAAGVIVADPGRGVLMLWRHRFITDNWGWELPAGAIEPGEEVAAAGAREVLEETGWRPGPLRHVVTYDVAHGITDHRFRVLLAEGAEHVGPPTDDIEAERIEWVPFAEVARLVAAGEIADGPTLTGLLMAAAGGLLPLGLEPPRGPSPTLPA